MKQLQNVVPYNNVFTICISDVVYTAHWKAWKTMLCMLKNVFISTCCCRVYYIVHKHPLRSQIWFHHLQKLFEIYLCSWFYIVFKSLLTGCEMVSLFILSFYIWSQKQVPDIKNSKSGSISSSENQYIWYCCPNLSISQVNSLFKWHNAWHRYNHILNFKVNAVKMIQRLIVILQKIWCWVKKRLNPLFCQWKSLIIPLFKPVLSFTAVCMQLCNAGCVMNAHLKQMNTNYSGCTTNWQPACCSDTAGLISQLRSKYSEMSIIDKTKNQHSAALQSCSRWNNSGVIWRKDEAGRGTEG